MPRLTKDDIRALSRAFCFDPREDWHAMSSASKANVIDAARSRGYRAPKNANGSIGRYLAEYCRRTYERN